MFCSVSSTLHGVNPNLKNSSSSKIKNLRERIKAPISQEVVLAVTMMYVSQSSFGERQSQHLQR